MAVTNKDTYPVLRTTKECARLFTQFHLMAEALGGYVLAPLDLTQPNLRILDVGTGSGKWLSLVKEQMPEPARQTVTLVGTDIAPYPDSDIAVKLHNFKDSFPVEWEEGFDLVQMRSCLMMSPGDQAAELVLESDKPHEKLFKIMGKCVLDMGMDRVQGGRVADLLHENTNLVELGSKSSPMRIGKGASPDFEKQIMEYLNYMFGNLEHAGMLKLDGLATLKSAVIDEAQKYGFDFMMYGAWAKRS